MITSNKENSFVSFLIQKYSKPRTIDKTLNVSDLSDFKLKKEDNLKNSLSTLQSPKLKNLKDVDDKAVLKWSNGYDKHYQKINDSIKNAKCPRGKKELVESQKFSKNNKSLKEIEEKNSKIIINLSILNATVVLTFLALIFLPKLTFGTLGFLDSCVLYPFNKLEQAYNFNYNEDVFHVAKVDRNISSEMKSRYIRNINSNSNNINNNVLKVAKNSLSANPEINNSILDNGGIIVMGMDNSDLIKENKDSAFKLLVKKIAEKQIEFVDAIGEKFIDLIY